MLNTVSKMRGKVKAGGYPQTEGILGECMLHYGNELGAESGFGMFKKPNEAQWCFLLLYKCQNPVLNFATIVGYALLEMGEALKQVAQAKDCMDVRVKRTFIDPLQSLQQKELKEIGVSLEYNVVNGIICIPGFNLLMFRLSVLSQMHLIHSIKALV